MASATSSNKRSTADPFEWTSYPHRTLLRLLLYYESVRLPRRFISASLLQLVGNSRYRSDRVLPSSSANLLTTRHGLRPRPVSACSPFYAYFVAGFQNMKSLTSDNME